MAVTMRLGIFGGSFDPVHRGHLRLAECGQQQLELDEVRFVPTANQPLKPAGPHASAEDRLAMLRLAIDGRAGFSISEREIARGGTSYTVDTLKQLADEMPGATLYLLLGADAVADLPRWRQPEVVCELATIAAVHRAGLPAPNLSGLESLVSPRRLAAFREAQIEMPPVEASSSEIRRRIAAGAPWESMTTEGVAAWIHQHRLYLADTF